VASGQGRPLVDVGSPPGSSERPLASELGPGVLRTPRPWGIIPEVRNQGSGGRLRETETRLYALLPPPPQLSCLGEASDLIRQDCGRTPPLC